MAKDGENAHVKQFDEYMVKVDNDLANYTPGVNETKANETVISASDVGLVRGYL